MTSRRCAAASGQFGVRVPKVESPADIERVAVLGRDVPINALIETARGARGGRPIAAHPAVDAIGLGESDLASDLGSAHVAVLDWARVRLLVAVRAPD